VRSRSHGPLSLAASIGILEMDREADLLDSTLAEADPLGLCASLTYWFGLITLEERIGSAREEWRGER
jgi:hypothetical protein